MTDAAPHILLDVEHATKDFATGGGLQRRHNFRALDGVSISIRRGECFGIVGESGSGKTTLARSIMGIERLTSGRILFKGFDLAGLTPRQMQEMRAQMQIVFQDPYTSLNPMMSVRDIIAEPLEVHQAALGFSRRQQTDRVVELLELVSMDVRQLNRYPHEFSGGQRQRIGIARALACHPDFVVLDEPTSALDVSVQAQVLSLLRDLQTRLGLTYLFISHDLAVIRYMCSNMAVMHRGRIVEQGSAEQVFGAPESPYTRTLLDAVPDPDPDRSPFNAIPVQDTLHHAE